MSPRTGRPTDNPKPYKITVRIDEKGKQILDKFCEQKNVNQNEAIWRGILRLEEKIKKQNTETWLTTNTFRCSAHDRASSI